MPNLEEDLSFAEVGVPQRPDTARAQADRSQKENADGVSHRRRLEILERETGFEPATLSLGSFDTNSVNYCFPERIRSQWARHTLHSGA